MRYGHFDTGNKEYVIEKPNTPLPWINYLGCEKYCALISNTAGGYSFYGDPRERRITRYRYDNVPFDQGGRYIYVRDEKSGEFWSPTWQPTRTGLKKYSCRHGMGYTVIASENKEIATEATYFVPLGEDLEIWKVKVKNNSKKVRNLSLISYIEFCLWDAVGDASNFQRTWNIGQAHAEGNTIYHTTMYGNWMDILAYFHCSAKVSSYDTQRKEFLGNFGYNGLEAPDAVVNGKGSNSEAIGWAPIGSHCTKVTLKPGQEKTIIFVLGVAKDKKHSALKIKKYATAAAVDAELKKLKKFWEEKLSIFSATTPDEEMNEFLNVWNQYQCMTTFNWSRFASYYEAGIGRGMGFRDSNQDTLGFGHMIPDKVRKRILDLASIQFADGSTYHQYSPITGKGDLWGYSDDQLWLIYSTAHYLKETGDFTILEEKVPFAERTVAEVAVKGHHEYLPPDLQKKEKANPKKFGTLYQHLRLAIKYTWDNLGKHDLPKSGFADWNDCLNLLGKKKGAESVLVGMMLVGAADLLSEIAHHIGEKKDQKSFLEVAEEMREQLNDVAWDGDWYKRAFDDKGKPVGSKECKEGKIYLETQAWAVFSNTADQKRGRECMDAVHEKLATKYGIVLQQPAMRHFYPELGEISTYPPGLKENASIFCHPNPWAIIAETMLSHGERAFHYYKAILPSAQNDIAEIRKTEPYVYCQMVAGPDHPDFGEGKNSWLTGSASWNFVAAAEYILGIRPDYDGLIIDPCIPKGWNRFEVKRVFRDSTYIIEVSNPNKVSRGVKSILVDGEELVGNVVPVFDDGKKHLVEVEMG
ncbi:MAG: glycosyl transferase [Candidatus Margulisbacteria bacterium]|nr:glycosyl transferase [Candidatus Margulisiibacteriota bacterium]MBU1021245.1 glycosyl transferase [Candidatus Margulisiibacteriota bacterium]MBU1729850.1 glycosyl transferase [Candidatus Margulisiibacteriota bacterium]MBU1955351.1 glycosyl transferase [Candidatus Margulisiibacteriota bacterium]